MCCFSGAVRSVSKTSIFARFDGAEQLLVYSMALDAPTELAMILPLPLAAARDGALSFVNLEGWPNFFDELRACFPEPVSRGGFAPQAASLPRLKVERVGAFEASYVPTVADFERLDPRFRLSPAVWRALPAYADYGFAVFKLARGSGHVHPMAFRFRSRDSRLFFPTVHVHDGSAKPRAQFDHTLYAQTAATVDWQRGELLPAAVMRDTRGLLEPTAPVWRRTLHGVLPNTDHWLAA